MDFRFKTYITSYLVTLVLYFIMLLADFTFRESLVSITFILAGIFFIFTKESKVDQEELMEIPSVHYYQKTRINTYGYMVSSIFAFFSLIFYLLIMNTKIDAGLIAIVLWGFYIVIVHFIKIFTSKVEFSDYAIDYIKNHDDELQKISSKEIKLIIFYLEKLNKNDLEEKKSDSKVDIDKSIINFIRSKHNIKMADKQLLTIIKLYYKYLAEATELTADEIDVIKEV